VSTANQQVFNFLFNATTVDNLDSAFAFSIIQIVKVVKQKAPQTQTQTAPAAGEEQKNLIRIKAQRGSNFVIGQFRGISHAKPGEWLLFVFAISCESAPRKVAGGE
jgi:hypothetical protein